MVMPFLQKECRPELHLLLNVVSEEPCHHEGQILLILQHVNVSLYSLRPHVRFHASHHVLVVEIALHCQRWDWHLQIVKGLQLAEILADSAVQLVEIQLHLESPPGLILQQHRHPQMDVQLRNHVLPLRPCPSVQVLLQLQHQMDMLNVLHRQVCVPSLHVHIPKEL